jgi:hypothetical protein
VFGRGGVYPHGMILKFHLFVSRKLPYKLQESKFKHKQKITKHNPINMHVFMCVTLLILITLGANLVVKGTSMMHP